MNLESFFPIIKTLKSHQAKDWRQDLIAGLTVAVMLVPQGMAYAMLAGVPPIYGLYGGLIPLFLYAILGTSRQMSIGPVAVSALLVLAGVSQIAEPMSEEYISLVLLTGLLIGCIQLVLGLFRLGFLVNFISHPVIVGFTAAAAIIIAISQFKDLFGFHIPRYSHSFDTAVYAIQHLAETNWVSLLMCLGSITIMLVLKKISRAIPGALIVVVAGTLIVYFFGENALGINIVKKVPEGLPDLSAPLISWENIRILIPTVLTVTIIGIVESIGIAKVIQAKHGDYQIRPNQELIALGISKIGGAFFQAIPSSGSFTRSAVNDNSGARSGFASIVTAFVIGLTLLFLTPLFYFLPKAVLAAIILLSVFSLFDLAAVKHLWKADRQDFFMMLVTFLITLALGIEEGVLAGVILSIAAVLYKSSKPHIAILGKLPGSDTYRNISRFESVVERTDILIIRFDDQLYFANSTYFQDSVQEIVEERNIVPHLLILDASSIHQIDSTGFHTLKEIYKYLNNQGIKFYISGLIGPVRDKAIKGHLFETIGEKSQFLNIPQAVAHFENLSKGIEKGWSADAIQSNISQKK